MKALIILSITSPLFAEMRYNPINNLLYSHPETADINQADYRLLIAGCIALEANMRAMNGGNQPSNNDVLTQCIVLLQAVGTPTALRLIADLKNNTVHYANGSFMKKILP